MAIDTGAILALFRVLAGEFASTADATVEALASVTGGWVSPAAFGSRTSEAAARLTAHELTMLERARSGSGGVGAVTSIRTGDLSVSYAAPVMTGNADDVFRQTSHGLAYLAIRDSRAEVGFGLLT